VTLVPINVNVLIAGADEAETLQADLAKKYNQIKNGVFGGEVQNSLFTTQATEAGVHLHFLMPDALLHGTAENDTISFPELPNRWIIQRIDEKKNVRAWLVRSDFISDDSQLPNNTQRVSVPNLAAGSDTDKLFFYMGDYSGEDAPPQNEGAAAPGLTAALAGDPVFTAFYPSCRTVFGFYDDMKGAAGTFTYLVTGYYSDKGKDPLRVYTADKLAWNNTGAPRCLFHGYVGGVTWNGAGRNYTSLPEGDISVCVGNTSAEGLSAYIADIADKAKEPPALERVLNGLQYDILNELDHVKDMDALINFEEMIHQKGFEAQTKNYEWVIKDTDALPQEANDILLALNNAQKDCDALERQIAGLQNEAFFPWYKYVKITESPFMPVSSVDPQAYLDKSNKRLNDLEEVKKRLEQQIKVTINNASAALSAMVKGLVRVPSSPHYLPNEPVLLFVGDGVARAFAQGFQTRDGVLPCRPRVDYDEGTLGGMTLNFTRFTGGDAELEDAIKSVLAEIFVKSKTPPFEIAAKTYSPPWQPLLMEWEVIFTPHRDKPDDTLSHFRLRGNDTDFVKVSDIENANPLTIPGNTLLTPHAAINVSEVINRYLAAHSGDAYTEVLSELAAKLKNMDALSQTLHGFNDFLIMRKLLFKLPAYSSDQPETAARLNRLVKYNSLCEPMPEDDAERAQDRFAPFRAGVLEVNRLWIVDSFGQHKKFTARTPEFDNYHAFKHVYISENVKADGMEGKALFPPRLAVPARVRLEFDACAGYVIPDFLDGALQVYTPEAVFAGIFAQTQWTIKTGAISSEMEKFLASFKNDDLPKFVKRLKQKFQNRITPGARTLFADCFGIPLALVTAKLSVQYADSPRAILWSVEDGTDNGFLTAPFSVLIGDSRRCADGIAEYFTGGDYRVYSPDLSTTLGAPPVDIAFLADPRGKIFIRTGLLPAYGTDIPVRDMSGAEFYFRSPVLADGSDFKIPTPDIPLAWSFNGIAAGRPDVSLPTRPQSMFEGYLKGKKNE
jgi:hypothetical protein